MCAFRLAWRLVLLAVIFLAVGFGTAHTIIQHAVAEGAKEYNVRLAGFMAGLFAGGIAAVLAGLVMLLANRRPSAPAEPHDPA